MERRVFRAGFLYHQREAFCDEGCETGRSGGWDKEMERTYGLPVAAHLGEHAEY